MIEIELNGKQTSLDQKMSLAEALQNWQYVAGTFAVAVNETFVAKAAYADTIIQTGDRIEVVGAMQGG